MRCSSSPSFTFIRASTSLGQVVLRELPVRRSLTRIATSCTCIYDSIYTRGYTWQYVARADERRAGVSLTESAPGQLVEKQYRFSGCMRLFCRFPLSGRSVHPIGRSTLHPPVEAQ